MDSFYRDAMLEHVAELEEEFKDYQRLLVESPEPTKVLYRAIERSMQLLIEACIGIAKQSIKSKGKQVPSDARKAFEKMGELSMDLKSADWSSIVGMRNAIVHDYLNLDRRKVLEVVLNNNYQLLFQFAYNALKEY